MSLNFIPHPLAGTPYGFALDLCLILAAVIWILSVITREYSWIDRAASLCPIVYCVTVAVALDFASARVNLMTVLVVLWGARLTFNFARKGGYRKGGEDYRWAVVREQVGPLRFQVINLVFVSFGQMLLMWLFTSPVHQAELWIESPLNWLDFAAAALFVTFLVGEAVADQQMWVFQQDKKRRIEVGEEVSQPFINYGLFRYSRHPNYLCELGMWWVFFLFGVAASGQWLHWTGLGFILLTAQFIPSIHLTESISSSKYPGYRDYQASTPMLVPRLPFRDHYLMREV